MSYFIFSDLHLHPHQANSVFLPSGRNSRLQHGIDAVKQVIDAAKPHDTILFAGDWYEDQKEIPTECIDASREIIDAFIAKKLSVTFLTGNHDQKSRDGLIHSLGLFNRPSDNMQVIDRPYVDDNWAYLPFRRIPDIPAALTELETLYQAWHGNGKGRKKLPLLCHVDLVGGTSNSGHLSSKGLNLNDLPSWVSIAISGHYHRHQVIKNFMFVGSPYQQTAGEMGETKVFLKTERASPSSMKDFEVIEFTGIPQYKEVGLPEWEATPPEVKEEMVKDFVTVITPHGAPKLKDDGIRVKSLPKPPQHGIGDRPVTKASEGLQRWLENCGRGDLLDLGMRFLEGKSA